MKTSLLSTPKRVVILMAAASEPVLRAEIKELMDAVNSGPETNVKEKFDKITDYNQLTAPEMVVYAIAVGMIATREKEDAKTVEGLSKAIEILNAAKAKDPASLEAFAEENKDFSVDFALNQFSMMHDMYTLSPEIQAIKSAMEKDNKAQISEAAVQINDAKKFNVIESIIYATALMSAASDEKDNKKRAESCKKSIEAFKNAKEKDEKRTNNFIEVMGFGEDVDSLIEMVENMLNVINLADKHGIDLNKDEEK